MKADDRHLVERQGVALVQKLAVSDLRWLFREQNVSDVGVDAHLEILVAGRATGRLLALQIKSGDSYFAEPVGEGFVYRGDQQHLEYWLDHSLPVIVIICRPAQDEAYWQVISQDTTERTQSGWKMVIPTANRFRAETAETLHRIATRHAELRQGASGTREPETVTHPDSVLGALLADPSVLEHGRHVIETSSARYTCSRIASMNDLLAVLLSANSSEGTVYVLRRVDDRWVVAVQLPMPTKYAQVLPAFFLPAGTTYCLVIQHPSGWGTGTVLYEEKWYLLAQAPRLILEYPIHAYVVGWGLAFDREIKAELTSVPTALCSGARAEIAVRVTYSPSSEQSKYEGAAGFTIAKTIRVEWDPSEENFAVLPESDMSPEEALGLYGEAEPGFVARNLGTLEALAKQADGGSLSWLRDLADRAGTEEKAVLCRALDRGTV